MCHKKTDHHQIYNWSKIIKTSTVTVCFKMSSCNFNNLSSSTDSNYNYQYLGSHSSNVQSVPIQQSSQPMQKCTFQCVCCARLSMGSVCSCNLPKSNASTQTNNFEFPQETLMANNMWIKGTFEHGIVQVFNPMSQLIFHKFWALMVMILLKNLEILIMYM